jgi:hypothetical protein
MSDASAAKAKPGSLRSGLNHALRIVAGSADERRLSRYAFLLKLVRRFGFDMHSPHNIWRADREFLSIWSAYPETHDYFHERYYHLYHIALAASAIPGDTVECGCFRGAGSYMIMKATQGGRATSAERSHHIFDSFEGLSEPDAQDARPEKGLAHWRKHDLSAQEHVVRSNLNGLGRLECHRGWIPERFGEVADCRFALVHIDVDLYRPTLDSLAFFYPRMSPGGFIVCDDYGSALCPGAKRAFDEFMASKPEAIIRFTSGQCLIVRSSP